ncbi:STE/STE11 protein kinase [Thecamonas trahens ATCC 50062]|uniref:STE/STE11 protein kinase n=1 Tax=Thecamonas trahens ATCC 50062 TaxID=461836 RepID=A0A0L0D1X7_THETB|nr:STE/STE11 protein kinase [Thecamonas trahens ATCC 50062]KNC46277.1 STE/STE11 protein kinase [Thecamonas trahens ATCC 50062]|eukprot:XP_013760571.1 STE/STE11 protein kinase [Thecamonas trahens ATCC 50062]
MSDHPRLVCEVEEGPPEARRKRVVTVEAGFMLFGRDRARLKSRAAKEPVRPGFEALAGGGGGASSGAPPTIDVLDSQTVSSVHFKIWYEPSLRQFFVCDCGSRNGTNLAPPAGQEAMRDYRFLGSNKTASEQAPLAIMSAIRAANVVILVTNIVGTEPPTRHDLSDTFNYTGGGTMTEDVSKQDMVIQVLHGPGEGQHHVIQYHESCIVGRATPGTQPPAPPSDRHKRITIYTASKYLSREHALIQHSSELGSLRPVVVKATSKNGLSVCSQPNLSALQSFESLPWQPVARKSMARLSFGDLVRCGKDTILLITDHAGPPQRMAPPVSQGCSSTSITLSWDAAISPTAVKGYILAMAPGPRVTDEPPAQFARLLNRQATSPDDDASLESAFEQASKLALSFANSYGGGQLHTTVAPLDPNRIYFFRLQARNAGGESSWSAVVAYATAADDSLHTSPPLPAYLSRALDIHNRASGVPLHAADVGEDTDDDEPEPVAPEPSDAVVQRVSGTIRWKKGKLVGLGAQGKVYVGQDLDNHTVMAVKELVCMDDKVHESRLAEIEREIDMLRTLDHPNIVKYIGVNKVVADGSITLHLFLEYVAGGSLQSFIKKMDKNGLDEAAAQLYTKQILNGLAYLHAKDIVHRDIKSANILLAIFGSHQVCKIADFGASKSLSHLAEFASVVGTPNFMAPEVIRQRGGSHKSDIWSVGCTVIEMLTGSPPWSEFEPQAAMFHIGTTKTGPKLPDNISPACVAFFARCFAFEPEDRASAAELEQHVWIAPPRTAQTPDAASAAAAGSSALSPDRRYTPLMADAAAAAAAVVSPTAADGADGATAPLGPDTASSPSAASAGTGPANGAGDTDTETSTSGPLAGPSGRGGQATGSRRQRLVIDTAAGRGSLAPAPSSPSFKNRKHRISWSNLMFHNEPIGKGGFGTVTRAEYLGVDVAVKFLTKIENIDQFMSEAALLAELRHPNCVLYMGVCAKEDEDRYGIVMEYLDGGDLHAAIHSSRSPPLNLSARVNILADVASGLVYLHAMGVAHRDIKLRNILLDRSCGAKLADFGLSTPQQHKTGATLRYAAPEVLSGERVADAVADVYSFGLVMYEVLTGTKPFAFLSEARDRYHDLTLPPGELDAWEAIDPLPELMRACWSFNRAHRPSMKELFTAIKSVRDSLSADAPHPAPRPRPPTHALMAHHV